MQTKREQLKSERGELFASLTEQGSNARVEKQIETIDKALKKSKADIKGKVESKGSAVGILGEEKKAREERWAALVARYDSMDRSLESIDLNSGLKKA